MAKAAPKDKSKPKAEAPRPRTDAYVMMLLITFFAVTAGTLLMYMDFAGSKDLGLGEDTGYSSQIAPKEPVPTLPKLGESLKVEDPPPETPPAETPAEPKKDPMDPMGEPKKDPGDAPKM